MQEPVKQPPEWTQVLSMFDALFSGALKYAEPLIKRMVDEQTAPLLERINTLQHSATTDIANLTQRIELLERSVVVADKAAQGNEADLFSRVAALEEKLDNPEKLDEDRIKEIADEVARDVLSEHVGDYDHDEYDRLEEKIDEKVNDAIDEYDFDYKINDALNGATVSISV